MIGIKILVVSLVAVILLTTFCFPGGEINNSTQTQGKNIHAEYYKNRPISCTSVNIHSYPATPGKFCQKYKCTAHIQDTSRNQKGELFHSLSN